MITDAENFIGTAWIMAPNWIRVRIMTCNDLTITVQRGTISVAMGSNSICGYGQQQYLWLWTATVSVAIGSNSICGYGQQHATYFDLKI
jgi:hypothetical protein